MKIEDLKRFAANKNIAAFFELLAEGESCHDDDAYQWLFGSTQTHPKLFNSFSDHPRVKTWEKYDGQFIKNGKLDYTTAAGKFQITETTWNGLVRQYGFKDFSPESQRLAVVALMAEKDAIADVLAGRIQSAIAKLTGVWASLPGASAGDQPTQKMTNALAVYTRYGGIIGGPASSVEVPPSPAPAPAPTSTPAAPAPSTIPAPAPKAKTMSEFIFGLVNAAIKIFSPLAQEKLTKELNKRTDSPEIAEQVANTVMDSVKQLTGQSDPLQAVAAATADPAIGARVEADVMERLERMAPILEKMADLEKAAWSASEASMDAASKRSKEEAYDMTPILIRGAFAIIGALFMVIAAIVIIQTVKAGTADTAAWAALTGLIGWAMGVGSTIYSYRFGTNRQSVVKDAAIEQLSRR